MELLTQNISIFVQLLVALLLGMFVGSERTIAGKIAGMRTYGLVSLGAALFTIISVAPSVLLRAPSDVDPFRMAANIIVGIGFLGAGLIFSKDEKVTGLTTAAGLWVAAGVGIAVGFELYAIAVFVSLLTLIVFRFLWPLEEKVRDISGEH